MFGDAADYTAYMQAYTLPCISALACTVVKDALWKPANRRILLLTRDKRRPVLVMAVAALHDLFVQVGEEYLILLPECLPFISELLEDESEEVLEKVRQLVRLIEDMSGEKLEQYLT